MLTIPFENLDVMNKVNIGLDTNAYYKKIILGNRGGFCYELNGLFNRLLAELGFSAYLIGATLASGYDSWNSRESHATQIVVLDQSYLVDVGFGNSARKPLPLNGEISEDVSGTYRIIKVGDKYFHKQKQVDGKWKNVYRFLDVEKKLSDFEEVCHYVQTSPKSHFTQLRLVTIATKKGRKTLSQNTLTITENGKSSKIEVDEENVPSLLSEEFNL